MPQFDKNSIVYYFSDNDIVKIDHHTVMYRIPLSKRTTWTTFKYGYIGNKINRPLRIKIVPDNTDNTEKKENVWHSIKPIRSTLFLSFQVTFPDLSSLQTGIRILLMGTICPKKQTLSN
jgi:hypothetical protein